MAENRDEVQKVDYELPLSEFMQKYREVSAAFFEHRELAHWQAEQFDKCVDNLPEGHIASLIDYSMNYSHNHATAVQGKLHTNMHQFCVCMRVSNTTYTDCLAALRAAVHSLPH